MADPTPTAHTDSFVHDELVVALPHQRLIESLLAQICPGLCKQAEQDQRLGLALYRLVDPTAVAAAIQDLPVLPRAEVGTTVERLLAVLRAHCASAYGGWLPTIGKNRHAEAIFAAPHIGKGGSAAAFGFPVRTDRIALPKATDPEDDRGVRVAVLDTGLYPNDELDGRYMADTASMLARHPVEPPSHYTGHSTFIAGLILAEAPNVRLSVHGVLRGPYARTTTWDLATGMARLHGTDVRVLNLSLACVTEDGQPPLVLSRAVDLLSPDMVIVAAAGNIGDGLVNGTLPVWPAALDKVVSVGAWDADGEVADFSVEGPWVRRYALGVDVASVYFDGKVRIEGDKDQLAKAGIKRNPVTFDGAALWTGTSFAAATVTGQIAAFTRPDEPAQQGLHRLEHPDKVTRADRGSDMPDVRR